MSLRPKTKVLPQQEAAYSFLVRSHHIMLRSMDTMDTENKCLRFLDVEGFGYYFSKRQSLSKSQSFDGKLEPEVELIQ